ncbi:hypothetical protein COCVIDRAFT_112449 [Bipolaris victoriae FI3]|uniref:Apple domain-containing protein n=1 Tax=Bipolaris victoriae (strain FI3) TaxID=930091 RepID=W7DVB6_BIPV3|nr:hypothetical protein COCVIDRAFT_112449 [Bipolaris victoriae FI3]
MLILARQSLLALACASAVIATPTPSTQADAVLTRDLAIRQDTIENCAENYTTKNGLAFKLYCQQNAPLSDAVRETTGAGVWFYTATWDECMEHCSRFSGDACYGMTWTVPGNHCWLKTSNVSTEALTPAPEAITALLIDRNQMKGYDTKCPNADLSDKPLPGVEGITYTTHCGKVIDEPPRCFEEFDCFDSDYRAFYHTETLEECLKICTGLHPLCRAVSWNPDLTAGYANCKPKYGNSPKFISPTAKQGVIHAAEIVEFDIPDTKCPEQNTYQATAGDKPRFDIHCGKTNPGRNITNLHTHNMTACIDACAASDKGCKAVLFSSTLDSGYNNCYLQNTSSIISDLSTSTYAVLADSDVPSSSPSNSSSPSSSSSSNPSSSSSSSSSGGSKAWIAGPVVGGIAVLAALIFAVFWWRKRKASKEGAVEKDAQNAAYGSVPVHDAEQSYYRQDGAQGGRAEMYTPGQTNELPGSIKYAHNASEAQELP